MDERAFVLTATQGQSVTESLPPMYVTGSRTPFFKERLKSLHYSGEISAGGDRLKGKKLKDRIKILEGDRPRRKKREIIDEIRLVEEKEYVDGVMGLVHVFEKEGKKSGDLNSEIIDTVRSWKITKDDLDKAKNPLRPYEIKDDDKELGDIKVFADVTSSEDTLRRRTLERLYAVLGPEEFSKLDAAALERLTVDFMIATVDLSREQRFEQALNQFKALNSIQGNSREVGMVDEFDHQDGLNCVLETTRNAVRAYNNAHPQKSLPVPTVDEIKKRYGKELMGPDGLNVLSDPFMWEMRRLGIETQICIDWHPIVNALFYKQGVAAVTFGTRHAVLLSGIRVKNNIVEVQVANPLPSAIPHASEELGNGKCRPGWKNIRELFNNTFDNPIGPGMVNVVLAKW